MRTRQTKKGTAQMMKLNYFLSLNSYIGILKSSDEPIFIYGMGDGCLKVLKIFDEYSIPCAGIFASDEFVRDKVFMGHKIRRLSEIEEMVERFTVVLAFGAGYRSLMDKIDDIAKHHRLIVPDMPVIGDGLFTKDYLKSNFDKLNRVYELLADEQSRYCYEKLIEFKITGDIKCLKDCETSPDEVFESVLAVNENEIYADLGAYTGDTVLQLLEYTKGSYDKIYAIEPNARNSRKLRENTSALDNITVIQAAAGDKDGKITVSKGGGRMIHRSDSGIEIDSVRLDTVLDGKPCTYIKYDVEGSESDAINGSYKTITEYAPKLCAAIYHRTQDIFDIPLRIHSLRPDYSLYVRHFPYYPAWDTNVYAVIKH